MGAMPPTVASLALDTRRAEMPESPPRLATLDDDGWTLIDAEERLATRDRLYWIPSRWERDHLDEHVPEGGHVKLIFRIFDPAEPQWPATEWMWVTLGAWADGWYHGHLANEPRTAGSAKEDMPVWFRAEHVIDYAGPGGEGQASAGKDVLQCDRHGPRPDVLRVRPSRHGERRAWLQYRPDGRGGSSRCLVR